MISVCFYSDLMIRIRNIPVAGVFCDRADHEGASHRSIMGSAKGPKGGGGKGGGGKGGGGRGPPKMSGRAQAKLKKEKQATRKVGTRPAPGKGDKTARTAE